MTSVGCHALVLRPALLSIGGNPKTMNTEARNTIRRAVRRAVKRERAIIARLLKEDWYAFATFGSDRAAFNRWVVALGHGKRLSPHVMRYGFPKGKG